MTLFLMRNIFIYRQAVRPPCRHCRLIIRVEGCIPSF
jgi:hypothetical protein